MTSRSPQNDKRLEPFELDLIEWEEMADGPEKIAIYLKEYGDRIEEILSGSSIDTKSISHDTTIVDIPTDTPELVRSAIRGKASLARVHEMRFSLAPAMNSEDRAALDAFFAEFMLAGALLFQMHPDVFEGTSYLKRRRPGRQRQSEAARATIAKKTAWRAPARTAIEQLIDRYPDIKSARKLYLKYVEDGISISGALFPGAIEDLIKEVLGDRRAKQIYPQGTLP